MKNKFLGTLAGVLFATTLGMSAANAFVIDTFLDSARLGNSGDATELAYLKSVTGDNSLTLDFKVESGIIALANPSDPSNSWFVDVAPNTPGFFLLKFGIGNTSATQHDTYVFENIGELDKIVWSNADVDFLTGGGNCPTNNGNGCGIGRLSHYAGTQGGGGVPPAGIPEPVSLLLFGAGLMGLALIRRRQLV